MTSLDQLLKQAGAYVDSLTPEQREVMLKQQAESWARAEASWPKPNYHYEGNTKVYHSFEDYCND